MRLALREAERARDHGDVPIGAVVVSAGEVIAAGATSASCVGDPTAHAEILALREAARALGSWRVLDATLYVTLEPCAMCAGAIVLARVPRVVFGASDPKAGAARQRARRARRAPPEPPPRGAGRRAGRGVRGAAERVLRLAARRDDLALRISTWRGGRAVECGGLENRCASDWRTESSNLSPSVLRTSRPTRMNRGKVG